MKNKILFLILSGLAIACSNKQSEKIKSENKLYKSKSSDLINENKKEQFPPIGWKIIGSCSTDFNGDDIIDNAYVIQEKKETISKEEECMNEPFNRKELIIKFGQKNGTEIMNFKSTKVFGECNWGIQGTDAFDEIGIRKKTLKLSFSTGGTLRTSMSYYFRYQDNDWFLIGYEETSYQVPSDDQYIREINYLTGKQDQYEIINGKSSQHEISKIEKRELIKLRDLDISKHNTEEE